MILIGTELEQAIAAIFCCCGLPIEWSVLDQIEDDCRENQRDAKQYALHSSRHACLSAAVDEYEPETVRLNLAGHRSEPFNSIITAASTPGFWQHRFFLERPIDAPKTIAASIETALNANRPSETFAKFRLVAFRGLDATRQLVEDESKPYSIKGYR